MRKIYIFSIVLLTNFLHSSVLSQVKLPKIISDNMVLQQNSQATLWGWAQGKVIVKPQWTTEQFSTLADKDGNWSIKFNTCSAGGPYDIQISDSNSKVILKDVMLGEVWLCSGQSNMQFPVLRDENAKTEIALAKYPNIRLFTVEPDYSTEPKTDCNGIWQKCDSNSVKEFSAVGYFFGKELYANLNVPIGLIDSSWGGTPAESWVKSSLLEKDEDFRPILDRDIVILNNQETYKKQYEDMLKEWQAKVEEAKKLEKKAPAKPFPPAGMRPQNRAGRLYNAMIHPLIPLTIKGVIWYQGESNVDRAYQYRKLFAALIENWRNDWGLGNFPFYFVQLTNFYEQTPDNHPPYWPTKNLPTESDWAELREAQFDTLKIPNTGMIVSIDLGEPYDIHPKNKHDIGKRLALWAMAQTYGFTNVVYSGPLYKNMKIEDDKIRIYYNNTGSGLSAHGESLLGFAIAGNDKKFVWANSKIENDTVVVWSDNVKKPVAVRYAWSNWAYCNLFNKEGLPASPFRTDNWEQITQNKR